MNIFTIFRDARRWREHVQANLRFRSAIAPIMMVEIADYGNFNSTFHACVEAVRHLPLADTMKWELVQRLIVRCGRGKTTLPEVMEIIARNLR